MTEQPTIIIVDDDPGIREALASLIRSVGLQANALASVPQFLNEGRPDEPTCLVLDVRLPGRSGLDFQRELAAANIHVPIIFITGYGDIPMSLCCTDRQANAVRSPHSSSGEADILRPAEFEHAI
jgi:FixJ family two-component response regulator